MESPKEEEEVFLLGVKSFFQTKQYQQLRNSIATEAGLCVTDAIKVELLHLWEASLYAEATQDNNKALSASTRYKLRKKNPCPIDIDPALMKAKNARLPKEVHRGLGEWLRNHRDNPYPNKAEKDDLSSTLGITPQQVNRWFIQRRKILRLRGEFFPPNARTSHRDDELELEEDDQLTIDLEGQRRQRPFAVDGTKEQVGFLKNDSSSSTSSSRYIYLAKRQDEHFGNSLLERLLANSKSEDYISRQDYLNNYVAANNPSLFNSGGSVEVMPGPLTPPQSVSDESRFSLTPTDFIDHEKPLDLSMKQPSDQVMTPFPSPPRPTSQCEVEVITEDVRMAVSALLTLSGCHKT